MTQVRAEAGHGDEVEEHDEEIAKSIDDHLPGIVPSAAIREGLDQLIEITPRLDGEVKEVEDDKCKNGQATPDHEKGGFSGLHRCFVLILGASCSILLG